MASIAINERKNHGKNGQQFIRMASQNILKMAFNRMYLYPYQHID